MDITNYKEIYGADSVLYGPYTRKSNRRKIVVIKSSNGNLRTLLLARLIIEISIGRKLIGDETVDHIDNNPLNDSLENLQVLTKSENSRKSAPPKPFENYLYNQIHAEKRSFNSSGCQNGMAKFTVEEIVEMRSAERYYGMVSDLMRKYNCSRKTIQNILNNKSYLK